MAQIIPLVAQLGSANTGLNLGYTVLNLDRTVYAAFSVTGVGESNVPGTYYVSGGVTLPDAGGYIVVGESGSDMVEVAVDAAPPTTAEILTAFGSAGNLDTQLSAINAKTTNLPASPAAVGSPMALADDAITAAKFDESTAFPLKQADTGSTAVARTGADGDTLETLSDQIDGVGAGTGTGTYTDTVTDGVDPLDNVLVQLSTDSAGANMAYRAYTGADGVFVMHPDPGTYYVWLELAGYSFTQGAEVVVT